MMYGMKRQRLWDSGLSLSDAAREMEAQQVYNNRTRQYEPRGETWAERQNQRQNNQIFADEQPQRAGAGWERDRYETEARLANAPIGSVGAPGGLLMNGLREDVDKQVGAQQRQGAWDLASLVTAPLGPVGDLVDMGAASNYAAGGGSLGGVGLAAAAMPFVPFGMARKVFGPPPDLRNLPVDDAVKIARKEPHLKASHASAEGKYVGGPRNVKTKQGLNKVRKNFDDFVARDPRGGDWYDRYRADVDQVTGGNPLDNSWMTRQHGQWSAGASPQGEIGFVLGENNGTLTGFPRKTGRPGPHEAHNLAARTNDASHYWLGPKTGEYANRVIPGSANAGTATGVNDFRHAINLGYTETNGLPQKGGLNTAQHRFADYETALAVDRANQTALGGRTDWTGEQLQAAPWVRQKADDLFGAGNSYRARAKSDLIHSRANDLSDEAIDKRAREMAFQDANKTIGNFYDKHTANATYESFPGPNTGNLPGVAGASDAQKAAIHADPFSTFATAPGGRDAIYSGLRYGDTGVAARVRPTAQSQGIYQPPGGELELNPGEVARPLVGIHRSASGQGSWPAGDRAMLDAGEHLRAGIGGQGASAAHSVFAGGKVGDQRSARFPLNRKLSPEEITKARLIGEKHGLGDIVDTGNGITATSFYPEPGELPAKKLASLQGEIRAVVPDADQAIRGNVDSVYADLTDAWKAGEGSGQVSQQILDKINVTPELRSAFDRNPYIAEVALNHVARDEGLAKQFGTTFRQDLKNLREIIGTGEGWVGRLEAAVKKGGVVPAVAAAFLGAAYAGASGGESEL